MAASTKGCLIAVGGLLALPLLMQGLIAVVGALGPKPTPVPTPTAKQIQMQEDAARQEAAAHRAELEKQAAELKAWRATPAGKLQGKHPEWSHDDCETIADRSVRMGMTAEQVRAAWGKPDSINTTVTANHRHEQWVWGHSQYAYFDDGILKSVQQDKSNP